MKKVLLVFLCLVNFYVNAQEISEPEFVGECVFIKPDNSTVLLEKHLTQNRTVASTGLMMTGIGKVRTQLQIPGCCSNLSINEKDEIKLIIKSTENLTDPFSIIKVFKFEKKKKFRRAEVSSLSNFGTTKSNNYINVSFEGKKFGESSYLIKLDPVEPGEYGIMIMNPNALDQKQTVISAFTVVKDNM
ncbi:hypothetical protein HX049_03475 [Myroides odoratimimus]|uniref:hypothetical protein n=1 Tax=Myroides odoratimimus TaxID=76832 RepID=UPI0025772729|nr:hypothetical protein [Myroides odoratimimus]MDM1396240.1 hypothetical protein [Myroides odoratimimus]